MLGIVQREPGWQQLLRQSEDAEVVLTSSGTLLEQLVVARCRAVLGAVEAFVELLDPDVVPADVELARRGQRLQPPACFGRKPSAVRVSRQVAT